MPTKQNIIQHKKDQRQLTPAQLNLYPKMNIPLNFEV